MTLHGLLDLEYGPDGDALLIAGLKAGADTEERAGEAGETLLHVAVRRYRTSAVQILLDHGADIDALNAGGKTAWAHAARRGFDDLAQLLVERGAGTALTRADELALAVVHGRLDEARAILAANPEAARTGNPTEDRLLADVAGRNEREPVELLISAGADLLAPALDDGTPLHQAAWFGQPTNARLLIDAGAPLEVFDRVHSSSPLGWAVHGSRYSGGAEERQTAYVELARLLVDAGSKLHYPGDPDGNDYYERLLRDAIPGVAEVLKAAR